MREERAIMLDTEPDWPAEDAASAELGVHPHARYADALAKQVRTIYCICFRDLTGRVEYGREPMPAWDGGETGFGSRKQPVWPKIAAVIMDHDADPFAFIRAQFVGVRRAEPPKPNQMYNENAVRRWRAYEHEAREVLGRSIKSDHNQIDIHVLPMVNNLGWDRRKALDYVLRDPKCGASPLVRYIVALSEQLPIAERFRERALLQYMFQTADYDALIGEHIPQGLKEEAREVRTRVAGQ